MNNSYYDECFSIVKEFQNTLLVNTKKRIQEIDAEILVNDSITFVNVLLTTGLVDRKDFKNVITRLTNNVNTIDFLPENNRGIFGQTVTEEKKVYINPNMSVERKRLYLFHELAHCCFKQGNTIPYIGDSIRYSTYYGYMTIEEALAQNIAETCYYASISTQRPQKHTETDRTIMPDIVYQTNYDYYGLYQPLAVAFGRTLRGVGTSCENSDDKILFDLSKKALKEDLLKSVIDEYTKDGVSKDLQDIFFALANIYSAKKRSFGMGGVEEKIFDRNQNLIANAELKPTPDETQRYYKFALNTMSNLQDYRQPLDNLERGLTV